MIAYTERRLRTVSGYFPPSGLQPAPDSLHLIFFSPHPIFASHRSPVTSHRSPIWVLTSHKSRTRSHVLPCIRNFFAFMRLRTLELSCGFFRLSRRLFSATCALFDKNTGVAYPFPIVPSHGPPLTSHFFPGLSFQLSTVDCKLPSALTTFRINTCISVASKQLYLPLESTLMKKPGEGGHYYG